MAHIILSTATFLLFLFFSPLSTTAQTTTVLDTSGNPLRPNSTYYILPVVRGRGGGITLTPINTGEHELCPLYVSQDYRELENGWLLRFFPVNPNDETISVSTDLNIVFEGPEICVETFAWRVTYDEATQRRYVGVGGVIGNPGRSTVNNWFRIEKDGSGEYDYKIEFCPSVCSHCRVVCGDVGTIFIRDDGTRFQGITDQALLVRFQKA